MLKGMIVFFIQNARISESGKTKIIPWSLSISCRNIKPVIRVASLFATSASTGWPSILRVTTGKSDLSLGWQAITEAANKPKTKSENRIVLFMKSFVSPEKKMIKNPYFQKVFQDILIDG